MMCGVSRVFGTTHVMPLHVSAPKNTAKAQTGSKRYHATLFGRAQAPILPYDWRRSSASSCFAVAKHSSYMSGGEDRMPGGVFQGAGGPRQASEVVGVQRERRLGPLAREAAQHDAARQRDVAVQIPAGGQVARLCSCTAASSCCGELALIVAQVSVQTKNLTLMSRTRKGTAELRRGWRGALRRC